MTKDTGHACIFTGDGKEGQCNKVADYKFKNGWTLCNFHAGFIVSTDYSGAFGLPKELK